MSEQKEVPAREQTLSPEEQREAVRQEVIAKMREKHSREDGTLDTDGILEDYFKRDEKLHYTRKEAKERRLREEEYVKQLEDKAKLLKDREEAELKDQKKFEELLQRKDTELSETKEQLKELDRLKKFEETIKETQAQQVESKISVLGKEAREIFETASAAMPEGAYTQKLALLDKLNNKPPQSNTTTQSGGGVETPMMDDDPRKIYELKQTNPERYKAMLQELEKKNRKE